MTKKIHHILSNATTICIACFQFFQDTLVRYQKIINSLILRTHVLILVKWLFPNFKKNCEVALTGHLYFLIMKLDLKLHSYYTLSLLKYFSVVEFELTPSIPNYKSFQESWRVKASQVWPNLYDEIITFMIQLSIIRFFINYIFIVHLLNLINFYDFFYNFGRTWDASTLQDSWNAL